MRDILCVPSTGPPEVTGLHLPSYSLQWGLQTGCISVLPLPPHQQKTNIFLSIWYSQYQMLWWVLRPVRFILYEDEPDKVFAPHEPILVFNWRFHQTTKLEPFQFSQTITNKVKYSSDKLTLNKYLSLTLLGRNISRLYGLHRDRISFCLELEETCGTVMNGFFFFFFHTNDRFCYIIGQSSDLCLL